MLDLRIPTIGLPTAALAVVALPLVGIADAQRSVPHEDTVSNLLLESGGNFLLENGGLILLEHD